MLTIETGPDMVGECRPYPPEAPPHLRHDNRPRASHLLHRPGPASPLGGVAAEFPVNALSPRVSPLGSVEDLLHSKTGDSVGVAKVLLHRATRANLAPSRRWRSRSPADEIEGHGRSREIVGCRTPSIERKGYPLRTGQTRTRAPTSALADAMTAASATGRGGISIETIRTLGSSATNSSLSEMSRSTGKYSANDVHDFLEELSGSIDDRGYSRDRTKDRATGAGESGGGDGGEGNKGMSDDDNALNRGPRLRNDDTGTLSTEDIEFLENKREIREALSVEEDLKFREFGGDQQDTAPVFVLSNMFSLCSPGNRVVRTCMPEARGCY